MGFLFDTAADKARKASIAADRAQGALKESARLLGDIERRLHQISKSIPANAPAGQMGGISRTMRRMQSHADRTLIHLRHLDTHIRHLEDHVHRASAGKH